MNPAQVASIPAQFSRVVSRYPQRNAVRANGAAWTYAELDSHSEAVAERVLDQGRATLAPVAVLVEHGAPMIGAVLGVLKAGRMYVGLDPSHPESRLQALLAACGTRLLLTDATHAALARKVAPSHAPVQMLDPRTKVSSGRVSFPEVSADAGAWLTYTSGSTGTPKGVWRNHATVIHHAELYARLIDARPDDRFTLLTPLSLAASATPLFAALLCGACVCPFDIRSHGVESLGQWLNAEGLTVCHAVPTLFRRLLRALPEGRGPGPLRIVRLGGEAVLVHDVEALRQSAPSDCVLMHALSSTETGLIAACLLPAQDPLPDGRIPVGQAVEGVAVLILDEQGQPVSAGSEGRLVVRSVALAQGYWGQPQETEAYFRPDPEDPRRRQFFSADVGRFRPDGQLEHLGRLDQQVKISGHRVDLTEIESALNRMDGVREAAVVGGKTAAETGTSLAAWIVTENRTTVTAQNCRRFLATLLPGHMIPRQIYTCHSLPLNPSGKVDRRTLEQALKADTVANRVNRRPMPRDDIEKQIARICESVMGLASIGRQENLFDLGADSLHTVEIVTRLSEAFAVELPTAVLLTHSTVESLAAQVAHKTIRHSRSPLVPLRTARSGAPLLLIPAGHGHVATFGQLARQLPEQPIYGFQAPGLEAECWPFMSIPAIADRYVQEVRALQPAGPVRLAGVCVGGIVAFEMARQLAAHQLPVSMVALIETNHPDHKGRAAPLQMRLHNAVRDSFRILRWWLIRGFQLGRSARWLPAYRRFIAHMYGRARRRYRPRYYSGRLGFVLAGAERAVETDDPRLAMSRHAAATQTTVLPYRAADLFTSPGVEDLAAVLRRWMTEVDGGGSS